MAQVAGLLSPTGRSGLSSWLQALAIAGIYNQQMGAISLYLSLLLK